MIRQTVLRLFLFCLLSINLFAVDMGLLINAAPAYGSDQGGEGFGFTGSLVPWLSAAPSERLSYYFSGKVSFEYERDNEKWADNALFELERNEIGFRPLSTVNLTLGRQYFRDSAGMISSGLFDGVLGSFVPGKLRLNLGAFYTGLLYKRSAEIVMSNGDLVNYSTPFDYGDFSSYFASRRVLTVLTAEFPDLTYRSSLTLSGLAQFDMNAYEGEKALHSQYLEIYYTFEAADPLLLRGVLVAGAAEHEDTSTTANFAASLGTDWELPGATQDMFSLDLNWGSGAVNEVIGPFLPVSNITQGTILSAKLSGLMSAGISYTARLRQTFSILLGASYFGRSDLETFRDGELDAASKSRLLGGEFRGSLVWTPQSMIRINAGGGAFFPQPGGAFVSDAKVRWNTSIMVTLSL